MLDKHMLERIQVEPGEKVRLKKYDTSWAHIEELKEKGHEVVKDEGKKALKKNVASLSEAQELLYASASHGVLIILQGMDAAGKDGTIKHVMSGVNPQGCSVHSFKQPSVEEVNHTFLWRHSRVIPERGQISIFNRSYYEDVLAVKVHPDLLKKQHLHSKNNADRIWDQRYDDINGFEHHLTRNGIVILKFFLHISKREQRERLLARLVNKDKLWKFSSGDLTEREYWAEYQEAYEDAISATNTKWAPWHIIPGDYKWAARGLIADVITSTIHDLKLRFPTVDKETKMQFEIAKSKLEKEK